MQDLHYDPFRLASQGAEQRSQEISTQTENTAHFNLSQLKTSASRVLGDRVSICTSSQSSNSQKWPFFHKYVYVITLILQVPILMLCHHGVAESPNSTSSQTFYRASWEHSLSVSINNSDERAKSNKADQRTTERMEIAAGEGEQNTGDRDKRGGGGRHQTQQRGTQTPKTSLNRELYNKELGFSWKVAK